jgi:hypothetical protein
LSSHRGFPFWGLRIEKTCRKPRCLHEPQKIQRLTFHIKEVPAHIGVSCSAKKGPENEPSGRKIINKFYLYAIAALEGPAKGISSTVLNPACLAQFSKSESV